MKRKITGFIELSNDLLDKILMDYRYTKANDQVVCIEDCTIGDSLLSIPYYHQLRDEHIYILCGKNIDMFRYFLPEIKIRRTEAEPFLRNPIYRYKELRAIYPDNKIASKVAVMAPHRLMRHVKQAKKLYGAKKFLYYGTKYSHKYIERHMDKYFNVIPNRFINSPYNYDVHSSRHVKSIFEGIFDRQFEIGKDEYISFYSKFIKNDVDFSDYIVIIADGSKYFRKYSESKWQIVLDKIPKTTRILVIGKTPVNLYHPNLLNLVNKTSLVESIKFVQNAKLVIGNETGLTHLGYLTGIPTICLLFGGHFGGYLPWPEFDDILKCLYKKTDCLTCNWTCEYANLFTGEMPPCSEIPPDMIIEAIEALDQKYNIFAKQKNKLNIHTF